MLSPRSVDSYDKAASLSDEEAGSGNALDEGFQIISETGDRALLVPIQEVLEGSGLPWSYINLRLLEDAIFLPCAVLVGVVLVVSSGALGVMLLVLAVPYLFAKLGSCEALEQAFQTVQGRLESVREYASDFFHSHRTLKGLGIGCILSWPFVYKVLSWHEKEPTHPHVFFVAEVLAPSCILAFRLSYLTHVRNCLKDVSRRAVDVYKHSQTQISACRRSVGDDYSNLGEQSIQQMLNKGFVFGKDWKPWHVSQSGLVLRCLVVAILRSSIPEMVRRGWPVHAELWYPGWTWLEYTAVAVNVCFSTFTVYSLLSYLRWCVATSVQSKKNKQIFCALTSDEQLELVHEAVCVDNYGHDREQIWRHCAGCTQFPRFDLSHPCQLKIWYHLRHLVCTNWVYPRTQVEAELSACFLVLLFDGSLGLYNYLNNFWYTKSDNPERKSFATKSLATTEFLFFFDTLAFGVGAIRVMMDSVQRNALMDRHIQEISQAQDYVFLNSDSSQISGVAAGQLKYMSHVLRQISTDSMKDRLFGIVIDANFRNQALIALAGAIVSITCNILHEHFGLTFVG